MPYRKQVYKIGYRVGQAIGAYKNLKKVYNNANAVYRKVKSHYRGNVQMPFQYKTKAKVVQARPIRKTVKVNNTVGQTGKRIGKLKRVKDYFKIFEKTGSVSTLTNSGLLGGSGGAKCVRISHSTLPAFKLLENLCRAITRHAWKVSFGTQIKDFNDKVEFTSSTTYDGYLNWRTLYHIKSNVYSVAETSLLQISDNTNNIVGTDTYNDVALKLLECWTKSFLKGHQLFKDFEVCRIQLLYTNGGNILHKPFDLDARFLNVKIKASSKLVIQNSTSAIDGAGDELDSANIGKNPVRVHVLESKNWTNGFEYSGRSTNSTSANYLSLVGNTTDGTSFLEMPNTFASIGNLYKPVPAYLWLDAKKDKCSKQSTFNIDPSFMKTSYIKTDIPVISFNNLLSNHIGIMDTTGNLLRLGHSRLLECEEVLRTAGDSVISIPWQVDNKIGVSLSISKQRVNPFVETLN